MLNDKIKKLKSAIDDNDALSQDKRAELHKLTDELHQELSQIDDQQKANDVASHTHRAVQASQAEQEQHAETLKDSVREFETSHPNLTRVVQSICALFGV